MPLVTPGKTFSSNEIVTPTNLNQLGVPTVALADNEVTTAKIANGAVTQEKLNSSVTLVPTGAIMPFAMNSAPSGWLAADGTAVSRTTYAALFAAIGTTYGTGDGNSTFNLPDLRGIFVRGSGNQTINGINYSGTFSSKQQDELKSHTHNTDYSVVRNISPIETVYKITGNTAPPYGNLDPFNKNGIQNFGGTETRPANIALLYCIKI